jgi:hypothetical protein
MKTEPFFTVHNIYSSNDEIRAIHTESYSTVRYVTREHVFQ